MYSDLHWLRKNDVTAENILPQKLVTFETLLGTNLIRNANIFIQNFLFWYLYIGVTCWHFQLSGQSLDTTDLRYTVNEENTKRKALLEACCIYKIK